MKEFHLSSDNLNLFLFIFTRKCELEMLYGRPAAAAAAAAAGLAGELGNCNDKLVKPKPRPLQTARAKPVGISQSIDIGKGRFCVPERPHNL